MATIAELYCKGVRQQTKFYYAQWLPNSVITLGTVGSLIDQYFFDPKTTLKDLGFDFDPKSEGDMVPDPSPSPLSLMSGRSASVSYKLAGEVNPGLPNVPQGKAGVAVEFSSHGAFVLEAAETYEPRIRNVTALERWILDEYKAGRWQRDWAVVVSLVEAPHASILVSESHSAKIELAVRGDAEAGTVQLGGVGLQFQSVSKTGTVLDMTNARGVTPLFKLAGLRRKWPLGIGGVKPGTLRTTRGLEGLSPERVAQDPEAEAAIQVDLLGGYDLP